MCAGQASVLEGGARWQQQVTQSTFLGHCIDHVRALSAPHH